MDKPKGITSHGVVSRLRSKLNMKRIGHAGALDPMATGLLIMLIGKATKASQYLISLDKTYEGTIRLGIETDSQDADGEVVAESQFPSLSEETVRKEMDGFLGDQYQTPPMFSARKLMACHSTRWLARERPWSVNHDSSGSTNSKPFGSNCPRSISGWQVAKEPTCVPSLMTLGRDLIAEPT